MIVKQSLYKVHPSAGGILRIVRGGSLIRGRLSCGTSAVWPPGWPPALRRSPPAPTAPLAARTGLFRRGGLGAVDRRPGAGIEPGERSRPGGTARRIEDDFLALLEALGDLDQLGGRPADLHRAPFQVVADGDEADFVLLVGEDRFMGNGDRAIDLGQGEGHDGGHAGLEPLARAVELEHADEVADVLAAGVDPVGDLADRRDLSFERQLRAAPRTRPSPAGRG